MWGKLLHSFFLNAVVVNTLDHALDTHTHTKKPHTTAGLFCDLMFRVRRQTAARCLSDRKQCG